MKRKTRWKKTIEWERKPKWDELIGGIIFCLGAIFVMGLLFYKNGAEEVVMLIVTLLLCKGVHMVIKNSGEGRKEYYAKIK